MVEHFSAFLKTINKLPIYEQLYAFSDLIESTTNTELLKSYHCQIEAQFIYFLKNFDEIFKEEEEEEDEEEWNNFFNYLTISITIETNGIKMSEKEIREQELRDKINKIAIEIEKIEETANKKDAYIENKINEEFNIFRFC